jgi:hypothetical protein
MRRSRIQAEQANSPEEVMYSMVQDYVEGVLDTHRFLFRANVVAVDTVGGQFELDPPNPRNSIRARIITSGYNANTLDDDLPIFWPLFPHLQLPVKENEHVYIIFEDEARQHGLWLTRIPQRLDSDSKNYAEGTAPYLQDNANENYATAISIDQRVIGSVTAPTAIQLSPDFVVEDVPQFKPRVGDYVIQGSNNTIIVLGRDRPGAADDTTAQQAGAGTIDLVAGRASEEMSTDADESRIYISRKTDADTNFGTGQIGGAGASPAQPGPSVAVKSTQIRIVAREGMKIVVVNGDLTIEGTNINVGTGATEHAVLGDKYKAMMETILQALASHTHPTPAGPSGPSADGAPVWSTARTTTLPTTLSQTVKVKG